MSKKLNPDDIIRCISALIARNKLWAGKDVQCYFITNKTAGCFTNIKKSNHYKKIFNTAETEALNFPTCTKSISSKPFLSNHLS